MNATKLLSAIAIPVAVAAVAGASHAETYDGVHALTTGASRAAMAIQGVAAARAGDQYSEAAGAGVQEFTSTADRSAVRAEAVTKAHDPFANLYRWAFYRDQIPAQYYKPKVSFTRQAVR